MTSQLHHPRPAGGRPGQPQGQQRGLRPAGGEPDELGRGHQVHDQLGPLAFQLMARARVEGQRRLVTHRRHHRRVAVPQEQGAVAHDVADDLVPVEIPLVRALGPRDGERERRRPPHVVGDAAGQRAAGALRQRPGPRVRGGPRSGAPVRRYYARDLFLPGCHGTSLPPLLPGEPYAGSVRNARARSRGLRRRLPVRMRAAWIPSGGGVRPRGRPGPPGRGRGTPPRVRARGLRRGRGLHLLRPPAEAAGRRQGGHPRTAQPAGPVDRGRGGQADRDAAGGPTCNTNVYEPGSPAVRRSGPRSRSRWRGRPRPGRT